jgi:molecular chaperone DnaJ
VKNPYEVLGVSRSATPDEIRAAFRKLAAKHHPDKNPGDDGASQRFKELNAAHQILSDPKRRAMFDRFGAAGGGSAAGGPFGMPIDFGELNIDGLFGELLDVLGIRVGDRGSVHVELVLTFDEAAFGCTKTVRYDRLDRCGDCGGNGAARGTRLVDCIHCQGRGRIRFQQGVFPISVERTCQRCQGSGKLPETPCIGCDGAGLRRVEQELEVEVPAGVENGTTRRVASAGNRSRSKRSGDLEIIIRVKRHEFFRRSGDDVICELPVTFAQATLGDEIEIPTLDGKGIMRIPEGTQPGTVLRIRGKGIPKRVMGGRGDQLVEVLVEIPTELNERQRELVMALADELGETVQPQQRTFMDKLRALFGGAS